MNSRSNHHDIRAAFWRIVPCLLLVNLMFTVCSSAQTDSVTEDFEGKVIAWDEAMKMDMPVAGANVYWMNTSSGISTDEDGKFRLALPAQLPAKAIISYIGFKSDTIPVSKSMRMNIKLGKSTTLKEIEVKGKRDAVGISTIQPINTEKITQKEILKAACCNLSEAFETSPTVNVAYKDAVTGAKEIQLLGLAGIYAQLTTENIPNYRGIAGIYGLSFIPGPWMESIQVTKGSGSVVNGYESTTGQINVEFKKPQEAETPRFYLNLFGESNGNAEINSFVKKKYNDRWSQILMVHGNYMKSKIDRNHDNFMDVPMSNQINIYDRWHFQGTKHLESQFGFKLLSDKREGGEINGRAVPIGVPSKYMVNVNTKRAEVFGKLGFVFPEKPFKSIGNIAQFTWHDMKSDFGLKNYNANEKSLYLQSIYQNVFGKTNHQYKTGLTYRYDELNEDFMLNKSKTIQSVPGVFFEYTYSYLDKLTLVSGIREDWVEKETWNFTPRFHGKYNLSSNLLTRLSAGKSYRTPYLFADNISMLASSKQIDIPNEIKAEVAWNYGVNLTWKFLIAGKEGSFVGDLYRTDFINQLVMDAYSDSSRISFYNLHGNSFAQSLQLTFNYELIEHFELRLAWKTDDVKSTYHGTLQQKPLVARDKALLNLSYATENEHWKFDYTLIWEGRKKLESTFQDMETGSPSDYSPDFSLMSLQLTKVFRKFELYAGAGNLLDYRQKHPIVNPENPFSNSFDATNVWGPVEGRRIYAGLRYSIL